METTRRTFAAGAAISLAVFPNGGRAQAKVEGSASEIDQILADRIDVQKKGVGMVVGMLGPDGRRVVCHGVAAQGASRPVDRTTLFGIGSIGKLFTAVLLADMVVRGQMRLEEPAQTYAPKGMTLPTRGRAITLADLATHTSGLPFMPPSVRSFERYAVSDLAAALATHAPARAAGEGWEYSNLGYLLLGVLICERAGLDYDGLVSRRITRPLGLKSTYVSIPPAQRARLAQGHGQDLRPVADWNPSELARIGGVYTTADDLMTFVAMSDGRKRTALGQAFALLPKTRRPAAAVGEQALGWEVPNLAGGPFLSKDGIARGYGASAVFDPVVGRGVVVLSNVEQAPTDIARHLLRPALPLAKRYVIVTLSAAQLQPFVGVYQLGPARTATVAVMDGRLFVQVTGLPNLPLSPLGGADFVNLDVGVEATFRLDGQGRATALAIKRTGGTEVVGPRVS